MNAASYDRDGNELQSWAIHRNVPVAGIGLISESRYHLDSNQDQNDLQRSTPRASLVGNLRLILDRRTRNARKKSWDASQNPGGGKKVSAVQLTIRGVRIYLIHEKKGKQNRLFRELMAAGGWGVGNRRGGGTDRQVPDLVRGEQTRQLRLVFSRFNQGHSSGWCWKLRVESRWRHRMSRRSSTADQQGTSSAGEAAILPPSAGRSRLGHQARGRSRGII